MANINRYIIYVTAALLVILAVVVLSNSRQTGIIEGKVTIGPFSPVEPSSGPIVPPGTYSSRSVILTSWLGKPVYIPLNEDGTFRAEVNVGTYDVTVSNCVFLGCKSSLPVRVSIRAGEITVLNIDIDTGIR